MKFKKVAIICVVILVLGISATSLVVDWSRVKPWTGFSEYTIKKTVEREKKDLQGKSIKVTEETQAAKTLWDWLQLAGIPFVLAGGGYLLSQREQERAAENLREEALQTYFDRISELLLEHNLSQSDENNHQARDVARARTLTVLSRLGNDGQRKAAIFRFLHEAKLIKKEASIINLSGADLCGDNLTDADLRGVNLSDAKLREAYLINADLSDAKLYRADLTDAEIFDAKLSGAKLCNAELFRAILNDADFTNADLSEAKLCGADLSGAKLCDAKLCDAFLFNADLFNADFTNADLCGADLSGTKSLIKEQLVQAELCKTTLRDGTVSNRDCGQGSLFNLRDAIKLRLRKANKRVLIRLRLRA
jgi:uncharacterized protein YjbI with pentapeptide repeats